MVTAIVTLLVFAALITLSIVRPSNPFPFPSPADRDHERQLNELRALSGYRSDTQLR
jgi:hypothetical protein